MSIVDVGHARRDLRFWEAAMERLETEFDEEETWIMQYEGRRIWFLALDNEEYPVKLIGLRRPSHG